MQNDDIKPDKYALLSTGMKNCSWLINCPAVAVEIMICRAEDVRNFCSTT